MADPFEIDASGPLIDLADIDAEHAQTDADLFRWMRDGIAVLQEQAADDMHPAIRAAFRGAAAGCADLERGLREAAEQ